MVEAYQGRCFNRSGELARSVRHTFRTKLCLDPTRIFLGALLSCTIRHPVSQPASNFVFACMAGPSSSVQDIYECLTLASHSPLVSGAITRPDPCCSPLYNTRHADCTSRVRMTRQAYITSKPNPVHQPPHLSSPGIFTATDSDERVSRSSQLYQA